MKKQPKPYYKVRSINKNKGIIFVESMQKSCDLSRLFRQIEVEQFRLNYTRPWRVIYKDASGTDYEIKMDHTRGPKSYLQWDRRYNPSVKTERWHGLAWDNLKNAEFYN